MKGRVQVESVGSLVLKDNPLGDPRLREVPVYLPPSYGRRRGARYPVIYYLAGFMGTGRSQALNVSAWKENLPQRFDRLIAQGKARECVLVFPDCFTAYGGSQYLDSSATGPYATHVARELVPFIEDKFAAARVPQGRAVMGKSSGGYGALMLVMRYPDLFGHCVSHSGDMFFEMCYGGDIPKFVTLLGRYGGSALKLRNDFLRSARKDRFEHVAVNMLAMAACYSPNPKSPMGFDLPFDERTGELIPRVWARWKEKDPVVAARRHKDALKGLKTLFFDCGVRDEFYLHLGARQLSRVLKSLGVRHVYEEHEFGHSDMSPRYDRSLSFLSRRLSA